MTRINCVLRGLALGAVGYSSGMNLSANSVDFHNDIFPVLEARCFECHSDEKQKGELRLDSPAWILRGSENGDVLTPGKADDSPIYYLTTYDEDDPDYMPSKGKGLTDAEKDLLKRWIDGGADFGEEMTSMMSMSSMVMSAGSSGKKYTDDVPLPPATYELPSSLADTVSKLRALGLIVDTENHDANFLEVSFTYADNSNAYSLAPLEPVAKAVVKLNFGRSDVSNEQLLELGQFENLTHLDLRKSPVTDAALKSVAELKSLEYLNLYDTAVSDAGLVELHGLKSLKQIYLHGTEVTEIGVKRLQVAVPGLRVVQ